LSESFRELAGYLDKELNPEERSDQDVKKGGLGKRLFGRK
jgi:hypothetical protein